MSHAPPALLADIGGTNARFAVLREGVVGKPLILSVADFPTVEDAMVLALHRLAPGGDVRQAVLALAGPVPRDPGAADVRLTNAGWCFAAPAIAARFGFARVRLVNDFLALAHALPHLGGLDLLPIGAGVAEAGAPMLVLGPGTGLGAAALVGDTAVPTEGGHIGLAPANAEQEAVIAALRRRAGRAGAEEALSGRGIVALHAILAERRAVDVPSRDAAAVLACAETCEVAHATRAMFLALLAGYAGDMALAWGARGGVFIAGGIMPRLAAKLDRGQFRSAFEAKPPMTQYLAGIPLNLITHPAPAFVGLAAIAAAPNPRGGE